MERPTEAQIKEFWEWCDVTPHRLLRNLIFLGTKSIDLNNLFKYAVPKLGKRTRVCLSLNPISASVFVEQGTGETPIYREYRYDVFGDNLIRDPALALFWAIKEITNASHRRA